MKRYQRQINEERTTINSYVHHCSDLLPSSISLRALLASLSALILANSSRIADCSFGISFIESDKSFSIMHVLEQQYLVWTA